MTPEELELIQFTKQWDEAMVSNDPEQISKFVAEDWSLVGSDGITLKSSFIDSVASGILTHHTMDSDELQCRIYGQTGIIISKGTSAGKYQGSDFSLYEWSTSVFIKSEAGWRCVLTMLTPAKSLST